MTATQRLKAIEQRAKALGWKYTKTLDIGSEFPKKKGFAIGDYETAQHHFRLTPDALRAAERLLSLHEPGPDVEVTINDITYKLIPWEDGDD